MTVHLDEKSPFRPCGCDLVEFFNSTGWGVIRPDEKESIGKHWATRRDLFPASLFSGASVQIGDDFTNNRSSDRMASQIWDHSTWNSDSVGCYDLHVEETGG